MEHFMIWSSGCVLINTEHYVYWSTENLLRHVDKVVARHLLGLRQTHDVQNAGCHVGKTARVDDELGILGDIDDGHGIERVGGIGSAVAVDGVVGIAVVGNDDDLVAHFASCIDGVVNTTVYSPDSFADGVIHTSVTHHVAVGIVNDDEVVFVLADGCDEFVTHLGSAHFGLQVVGCHIGRGHQDAVLVLEGLFPAAAEEEGHMGILLGLGDVQLALAQARKVFRQRVIHVLLGEEDVHVLEGRVVGRHAVVLQAGDDLHAVVGLVLLGQGDGNLLGAVVAEVEENHHVTFLDAAINRRVDDGLDELVGPGWLSPCRRSACRHLR